MKIGGPQGFQGSDEFGALDPELTVDLAIGLDRRLENELNGMTRNI